MKYFLSLQQLRHSKPLVVSLVVYIRRQAQEILASGRKKRDSKNLCTQALTIMANLIKYPCKLTV